MTTGINQWQGWGVSQIGPLHIQNSIPNQDSYIVKEYSWGIIGVVCDGLGSKKYSHIGSRELTKSIVQASKIFDFSKDIKLFEPLVRSLWTMNIDPYNQDETSTTLLFVIVKNKKIYIGRVGDGAIAIFGKTSSLIEEDKDSFTNYTTPFGRESLIGWKIYNEWEVDSVVLCSDGISEDIKKDKLLDFFEKYLLNYKDISSNKRTYEIKKWLENWPVRGHSDDKTIVAIVKESNE